MKSEIGSKYDVSLMTGKEIALMASVLFAFMIIFFSIEHVECKLDDGINLYKWQAFREFCITLCKIIIPVTYVYKKPITLKMLIFEFP